MESANSPRMRNASPLTGAPRSTLVIHGLTQVDRTMVELTRVDHGE
jgi:hypothetical protein